MRDRNCARPNMEFEVNRTYLRRQRPILKMREKSIGGILADNKIISLVGNETWSKNMTEYQEDCYDYENWHEMAEQRNQLYMSMYNTDTLNSVRDEKMGNNRNIYQNKMNHYSKNRYEHMVNPRQSTETVNSNCSPYSFAKKYEKPEISFECDRLTDSHESTQEYTYTCEPCMKLFKRLSTLKIHIFSHIKEAKIFRCPKKSCNSGFKSLSLATKHILHFHRDEREILIENLKKAKYNNVFRSYTALLDYYKKDEKNPFKGSFCFGCFTYPRSMSNHPCSGLFYALTQCPACKTEVKSSELEKHVYSSECLRSGVSLKEFE